LVGVASQRRPPLNVEFITELYSLVKYIRYDTTADLIEGLNFPRVFRELFCFNFQYQYQFRLVLLVHLHKIQYKYKSSPYRLLYSSSFAGVATNFFRILVLLINSSNFSEFTEPFFRIPSSLASSLVAYVSDFLSLSNTLT